MDLQPQRMKHDYTNEVQLKSLIIREKNKKNNNGTPELNNEINSLIDEYVKDKNIDLKNKIIELSEKTCIDDNSHNIFGNIILLMIKKILTKPNFSGYSWQDDFYSDSCYRVFKYIHNFDHTKTSKISGQDVSAFAYISQIIHNSILTIINSKNKEAKDNADLIKEHEDMYYIDRESENESSYFKEKLRKVKTYDFNSPKSLIEEIRKIDFEKDIIHDINYSNYKINYDEYAEINEIIRKSKGLINLKRIKHD
jgi:hypothetical protein